MSPFVHLVGEHLTVRKVVPDGPLLKLGLDLFVKLSGNALTTHIGANYPFWVDETLDNWDDMSVLSSNIDHEGAFQTEEIGRKNGRLVHEKTIELVLLKK
jgi:hypothetical protein